ncbi:hypothetical protein BSZ35_00055 [Salinibacter sp. 10B]|nr:hypothetical protein BSZ35_00055 [Salinibacter sp. 10B]
MEKERKALISKPDVLSGIVLKGPRFLDVLVESFPGGVAGVLFNAPLGFPGGDRLHNEAPR